MKKTEAPTLFGKRMQVDSLTNLLCGDGWVRNVGPFRVYVWPSPAGGCVGAIWVVVDHDDETPLVRLTAKTLKSVATRCERWIRARYRELQRVVDADTSGGHSRSAKRPKKRAITRKH